MKSGEIGTRFRAEIGTHGGALQSRSDHSLSARHRCIAPDITYHDGSVSQSGLKSDVDDVLKQLIQHASGRAVDWYHSDTPTGVSLGYSKLKAFEGLLHTPNSTLKSVQRSRESVQRSRESRVNRGALQQSQRSTGLAIGLLAIDGCGWKRLRMVLLSSKYAQISHSSQC